MFFNFLKRDNTEERRRRRFPKSEVLWTQLVQFLHDIISNLDVAVNRGHKVTDLIIMNFAKAFDKVPPRGGGGGGGNYLYRMT